MKTAVTKPKEHLEGRNQHSPPRLVHISVSSAFELGMHPFVCWAPHGPTVRAHSYPPAPLAELWEEPSERVGREAWKRRRVREGRVGEEMKGKRRGLMGWERKENKSAVYASLPSLKFWSPPVAFSSSTSRPLLVCDNHVPVHIL